MPTLLSLETSTKACSVAIIHQGEVLASTDLLIEHSHSEKLTLLIRDCVAYAGLSLMNLDAVAVAMGPGSYTGLRIGVATAKGLCYALDKPLIAINTLEAMAYQMASTTVGQYWYCPMLDARRMEVYCAIYNQKLEPVLPTSAKIIDESSFEEHLANQPIIFFGNGAAKCRSQLSTKPQAFFVEQLLHPSAKMVGILAEKAFDEKRFENLAYFEPFYLKEFVSTKA
jgi:tRNA threonylcarbamoyladenosine biosynthesis protein TsaB